MRMFQKKPLVSPDSSRTEEGINGHVVKTSSSSSCLLQQKVAKVHRFRSGVPSSVCRSSTSMVYGVVVCSQIHTQQAVDLALHVADEMEVSVEHEVGYSIPLENCFFTDNILRYCTDDVLLRELMSDPLLEHYGMVVIDQAHERTVSTDLLALFKGALLQRSEPRVALLSVTPASHTHSLHTLTAQLTCTSMHHTHLKSFTAAEAVRKTCAQL